MFKQSDKNYKNSPRFESRKTIQSPHINFFGENDVA